MFFKRKFNSLNDCLKSRYGKSLILRHGYNGLHLCIYFNRPDWISDLNDITLLENEKCHLGMTPIMLAMFLNRKKCFKELKLPFEHKIKVVKENDTKYLTIREFENFFDIEYLAHLEFQSPKLLKKIIKRTQKADKKKQVLPEEKWLGIYYKDNIFSGDVSDVYIKWIDFKKGYGLFANGALKKKKWIGQYTGYIRPSTPRKDQKNAYCFEYITGYKYPENLTIDAKQKGNITRFINHSYQPNLKPSLIYYGPIFLIGFLTNRDIKEGEELTYDYGPDYWKRRENPS